jgi:hypothetical protein
LGDRPSSCRRLAQNPAVAICSIVRPSGACAISACSITARHRAKYCSTAPETIRAAGYVSPVILPIA